MYGPSGSGKKTRVMAMLKEMFGDNVEHVRYEDDYRNCTKIHSLL
jgi:uridine kinase